MRRTVKERCDGKLRVLILVASSTGNVMVQGPSFQWEEKLPTGPGRPACCMESSGGTCLMDRTIWEPGIAQQTQDRDPGFVTAATGPYMKDI
jgi:hypothetical protein